MTKETRVGLLVGLFIVIIFGMILTEFKGAEDPLADATASPVIETDYYQSANPPQPALAFGPSPQQAEHAIHLASADDEPSTSEPVHIRVLPRPAVRPNTPVTAMIRQNPEPPAEAAQPVQLEPQPQIAQHEPAAPTRQRSRTYRVKEGDTLTRIAEKMYGENQGHLYTRIYQANRNQLADASSITVGQVLTIPDTAAPRRAAGGTRQVDLEGLRQFVREPRTITRRVYVVQSGDNLTRIARKVLRDGSSDAVHRLFEANKDKLDDPDSIVVGMRLQIPS